MRSVDKCDKTVRQVRIAAMFAKLKKKIQEESGDGGRSGSTLGPGSPVGPGLASPVRTDSGPLSPSLPTGSGYTSSTDEPNTTTKEDILRLLMNRTEQCKKLETKVTEYITVIKDKNRNIEKLELSLEKQQDAMSQRMQDLNEQYQTNRVKLADEFKKTLVQREQEFQEKITAIEEEKLVLEKKLRDRLYQREEENEEIQGLATQETAKVKHMLLNTQEELAGCKKSLEEKSSQLQQLEKSWKELETTAETLRSSLQEVTKERDKFCESGGVQADLVTRLTTEKQTLETQVVQLSEDLQQKTTRILQLESSNADLESRYVTLERNGDLNRNKTSRLLEEKSDEIDQLQERLRTLEERLQSQGLSGDERVTALERERESLEEKLSETRQQLTEVKSTWSDKITQLEDQVSHLNQKIAEDSEELAQGQEVVTSMREKFHAQMEDLKSRLEDAETRALENWELANQKDVQYEKEKVAIESQMVDQKALAEKREAELVSAITSLESELCNLQAKLDQEKHIATQKFHEVEGENEKMLKRCLEAEKMSRRLEDECSQLKEKLIHEQGECNSANEELERKQGRINTLQDRVSVIEREKRELDLQLHNFQQKVDKQQSELSETNHDKDDLMLRNAELSQQLEKLRVSSLEDKKELQEEIQQKSDAVVSLQGSLKEREEKVVGLEGKIKASEDEHNRTTVSVCELESLEQNIAGLEDQLIEKNKTIKMQQQRLTDLKKTLQRELKVQTLPNDLPIDSKDFAASPPTQRRNVTKSSAVSSSVTHPAILPVSTGNSTTTNSSHSEDLSDDHSNSFRESLQDDVNFEYLKHVVLKFMLSREAEALQLIKAVSVLLRFSSEEQRLIRDTLEWKMSWFGARPPLGSGQKAKIIPSNY